MGQGADTQRGEKLRSGFVTDREYEETEQHDPQQRGERKGAELSDQDGRDQDAGRGADREAVDLDASKHGADGNRKQQEDLELREEEALRELLL